MLKITDNVTRIEKEVQDGDFNLNLKDHILYLPSFVDSDVCKDVVNNLKNVRSFLYVPKLGMRMLLHLRRRRIDTVYIIL